MTIISTGEMGGGGVAETVSFGDDDHKMPPSSCSGDTLFIQPRLAPHFLSPINHETVPANASKSAADHLLERATPFPRKVPKKETVSFSRQPDGEFALEDAPSLFFILVCQRKEGTGQTRANLPGRELNGG